jgi:hypothetical protein
MDMITSAMPVTTVLRVANINDARSCSYYHCIDGPNFNRGYYGKLSSWYYAHL